MKLTTSGLAVLGLATIANAHMKLKEPAPYPDQNNENGPLAIDGSDYPCKGSTYTGGTATQMAIGSTQQLSTIGQATHGGGSCQLSITYDAKPNANSVFKVIHSIIGGCPIINNPGNAGEDASVTAKDTYPYTIPEGLPTGSATLAWTWFNKVGNREMYMNCAPIEIVAASSKRSDDDEFNSTQVVRRIESYDSLPNMFKANINIEGAGWPEMTDSVNGADLVFPNPGDSVAKPQIATMFLPKLPSETGILAANGGSGSGSGSSPASSSAAAPVESASNTSPVPTTVPTVPGGVFITVDPDASSTDAPATSSTPAAPTTTTPVATSPPIAEKPSPAASSPIAVPTASPSAGGGSSSGSTTAGSACSVEGQWNCIDGSSFQRCASGVWSAVQQLSAGTECTVGASDSIAIAAIAAKPKRAVRFSHEHFKRHLHSS